ncbi:hypothetical protein PF005_g3506 [Phytophthora fragariae]|uniref:Uncharacterized protein n=1 Tax=Phytophthora fragariae TaxID=53985 RepID=A0A6A3UPV7_9STRA|nr:hypothetical protein PF003_g37858 [Phytophthora fragariae]KAE8946495.1 hypothetical protein PF009_g3880 [Phytophthora fragariae]KAE9133124.1 hypothetical protein PF007_g3473 [Phytophthora fragariae]KAE9152818.1 hypothetical protein PF006_g3006 [Phytophthora fragariae]KAE9230330.1 hypothetical protein PF005_g3506 [Phytophthora fragariae]
MERKVPPPAPRGFGAPPAGVQAPFARRSGPPSAFPPSSSEQSAPPPPPQQPHAPQSFGFQGARGPVNTSAGATRRGWRPGRTGGRHDSPLYGKHRKRPSSSSIDSNVSWSGSEIDGFGAAQTEQEQVSRLSWASSVAAKEDAPPAAAAAAAPQGAASAASLFGAPTAASELETKQETGSEAERGVQPPKTPLGKPTLDDEGGISAAQRVRMELSAHAGSRPASLSNSSENVFVDTPPPVYDEEKNGPQSCPSTFNNTRQPQFSIDKLRQLRSNELVASKLLPTRTSVNSLMGYVRELQLSEASLRKQLVKTKQHTEEELTHSLSKVSELEKTMQEVERDREEARRKLEEQEQLIRDLAAKLKQAETAKARSSAPSGVDELPPIAEEVSAHLETPVTAVEQPAVQETHTTEGSTQTPALPTQPTVTRQVEGPAPPLHPDQPMDNSRSAQFGLASPRSPNRPLWDPWASGGATPMKNLPPVFTIGSTGLDPVVSSSTPAAQSSSGDANSSATGEYELKSVLMSPRRVQGQVEAPNTGDSAQIEETESTVAHPQQDFSPQYPTPVFNVGAVPSPPYPQEQNFVSPAMQNESQSESTQQEVSRMESPSQDEPVLPVAETPPPSEWSDLPAQKNNHPGVSPVATGIESSEGVTPPAPAIDGVASGILLPPPATAEDVSPQEIAPDVVSPPRDSNSQSEQRPDAQTSNVTTGDMDAPPAVSAPTPPASSPPKALQKTTKTSTAEPVSLETLLVDFFTEVDKKQLKMAKVYGKRYAGREKWLFAELTKRYGAAKVGALKTRFETGSTSGASNSNTSSSDANNDQNTAKPSDTSDRQKTGRQGHPRHPQFFHPPSPASNVDLSANMPPVPPPVVLPPENDTPDSQTPETANGTETPSSPSGKMSPGRGARLSPRQRRSGGNIPPFSGPPPPSFSMGQDANEGTESTPAAVDVPPAINGLPPPAQRKEPMGQFNRPAPSSLGGMDNNPPTMGLRQRHNASGAAAQSQNNSVAETPAVTLEGLLKELYKKHQPDKLKNVPIVAKQYAGKERELVGLLKGKYGALSVKPLEENLEVLERAHRARMGSKNAGKKRGCFVRTMSLVFWLSVLLYFSLGAVFVSFVVLDAWECHALDNDEQELESAEECTPLKKELDTFTYERVGDYVVQSHPESCFCSEWKARESALLTNLSGADLVNLARMVPFSPDSFGAPWIASVKEQVPSQEFYDSYAKPVVDVSLDVGSFVWASVVELAGFDEAAEKKSAVISDVVENDTADVALVDDEGELDTLMNSLKESYGEVDTEGFVGEAEFAGERYGDAEVEAAVIPDPSEQLPIENENDRFQDERQTQERDSIATDDGSVGDDDAVVLAVEAALVTEDNVSFASEELEAEQHATVDLPIDELESEVDPVMEETEASLDVSENEDTEASLDVSENEDTEASLDVSENDSVDVAVINNVDGAADIIDGESSAESEEVVEMEVRQEGLDLSYPETVAGQTEYVSVEPTGDVSVDSAESLSTDLNEGTHAAMSDDDVEGSAASGDVEVAESEVELDDVSLDETEKEAGLATNASEEDEPSESGVAVAEAEVSTPGEVSEVEVENVDEESANPAGLETEAASDDYHVMTPSEVLESVVEDVDGESSVSVDMEVSAEPESETVPVSEVYDDSVFEAGDDDADVGNSIDFVPEEEGMSPDDNDISNALDEEPIVTDSDAVGTSDVAEEETVFEASSTSSSSEEAAVNEDAVVSEEAVLDEEAVIDENAIEDDEAVVAEVGEDGDEHVEVDLAVPVEVEDVMSAEDDAGLDDHGVQVVDYNEEDGPSALAETEAETAGLTLEEDGLAALGETETETAELAVVEDVDSLVVEGLDSVEAPDDEAPELIEDNIEEASAPVEVETIAEEGEAEAKYDSSSSENGAENSDDGSNDAEVVEDNVESTDPIDVETERSVSEHDLVGDLVEESGTIEASEMLGDDVATFTDSADEPSEQVASQEIADGSELSAVAVDEEVAVTDTNDEESMVDVDEVQDSAEVSTVGIHEESSGSLQELSAPATEEAESGGLASAVNEVLARLVEPFEAAKTAAPAVTTEGDHVVDEL